MRFATWLAIALVSGTGWAQTATLGRQAEIERIAPLYGIDLAHGDWQHEPAGICPAFTRHSFAYFHRSPQPGVRTAFMAVLPLQGGPVRLVPITGRISPLTAPVAENPLTIKIFNDIFQDELHHTGNGSSIPGLTWTGYAQCYADMVGEHPAVLQHDPNTPAVEPPLDLRAYRISSLLVPVVAPVGIDRAVSVKLDAHGTITSAEVNEIIPVKRR